MERDRIYTSATTKLRQIEASTIEVCRTLGKSLMLVASARDFSSQSPKKENGFRASKKSKKNVLENIRKKRPSTPAAHGVMNQTPTDPKPLSPALAVMHRPEKGWALTARTSNARTLCRLRNLWNTPFL